ncbi:MAG: hypothetical protein HGA86_06390 [Anaerolineaceae bacterium]|nr:hypothetical protein [Anaerolineaceae bacterium]
MRDTPQTTNPDIPPAVQAPMTRRAKVFGRLNLAAALFFLVVCVYQLNQLIELISEPMPEVIQILMVISYLEFAVSIFCLGAFAAGGVLLLKRKKLGRTITRLTGFVGAGFLILAATTSFVVFSRSGQIGTAFAYAMGVLIRFTYPFLATWMLRYHPSSMDLE